MQILKDYAMRLVGKPYIWGGDDSIEGYDCSGLVIELLTSCGLFPHGKKHDTNAQGLYNKFVKVGISSEKGLGSLVFFGRDSTKITHVGFMLDDFRMIEAGGGGSKTKTVQDAIDQNAFIRIRPINIRNDIVEIIKLDYRRGVEK